ncbi:MAG TPA: MlaD family protein [Bacteroidales bacterium]|nr:MlaD family protein [Bacteroidales bacterium]HOT53944.1 MlaD family protein [Bacteroidales bacterium]HQI29325.1 MlaD family protein [Bacteroidales bacterium]
MKIKKYSREFKIGVFSLVVIVALYFVIQFLKGNDFFRGTSTYYAIYPNVAGLAPTSPVSVLGLTAGTIDKIDFDQEKQHMVVTMKLKKGFRLPLGTEARIYSADILGGKAVQLILGDSTGWHQPGDTLDVSIERDLISMLTTEIVSLKDDISTLIANLNQTVLQLNDILDSENSGNIRESLNATLGHVNSLAETLNRNSGQIDRIFMGVDTLATGLNKAMADLSSTLDNFDDISAGLKDADLAGTIEGLHKLLDNLSNPEGTVSLLGSDPGLYNAITDIISRADSLIRLISDNPKKYLKITVF